MWNEVLQWVLLGVLTVLVGAMYWSYGMAVQRVTGRTVDTTGPRVGSRLPDRLLEMRPDPASPSIAVFVSENCNTCARLLASLEAMGPDGLPNAVLVAYQPTEGFRAALSDIGLPLVSDDGTLWRKLSIGATPFLVYANLAGRVESKDLNHVITEPQAKDRV